MTVLDRTLYVLTPGTVVRVQGESLRLFIEGELKGHMPLHRLGAVVIVGDAMVSSRVLQACTERGIALTYLSRSGRMMARVDAPGSGNVLLRRAHYRAADDPAIAHCLARMFIAGKVRNTRSIYMRFLRETSDPPDALKLLPDQFQQILASLKRSMDIQEVRGLEGAAAKLHFGHIHHLITDGQSPFAVHGRSRRPPRDPFNATLSFVYSLLMSDCSAALAAAGLDPQVGFLHTDRPGRPSLALDLMEEFRPVADRFVLTLINRKELSARDFRSYDGGAVLLRGTGRKSVVSAWVRRKETSLKHPVTGEKLRLGLMPFVQARLLARFLRGDLTDYVPFVSDP